MTEADSRDTRASSMLLNAADGGPMVTKEELALVDRHLAAENEHRMDDTLATLHPDCVFEDIAMGKVYRGREGAREYYATWWTAFDLTVRGKKRHLTTEGAMIAETSYVG